MYHPTTIIRSTQSHPIMLLAVIYIGTVVMFFYSVFRGSRRVYRTLVRTLVNIDICFDEEANLDCFPQSQQNDPLLKAFRLKRILYHERLE